MSRKTEFVIGEYYHIYNRGVEKRQIFMDDKDRFRFLHDLYEFNDKNYIIQSFTRRISTDGHLETVSRERNQLVDIVCFCLMPNHFHILLTPLIDNGVSIFMHKLGMGYTKYFNRKYERSGVLFQGTFKSVHVKTESQLMHLSRYIHLINPGELIEPNLKKGIIKDKMGLTQFIKKYKWSSFLDYTGIKNYPSLINKELLISCFKDKKDHENFVTNWIGENAEEINNLTLE